MKYNIDARHPQELANPPANLALTGRVADWLTSPDGRLPVSCTVLDVQDSMEGHEGIEYGWLFTSHGLRNGAGVALNLNNLRPAGSENGKGLTASGAVSFLKIFNVINEVLRRGGLFKNGAITAYLDYDNKDVVEFLTLNTKEYAWVKRALYVDDNIFESPHLDLILEAVDKGYVWLAKKQYDSTGNRLYSNVCVTADTWVETDKGITQVKDLFATEFKTPINGVNYSAIPPLIRLDGEPIGRLETNGFFQTGVQQVFRVNTIEGFEFKATLNHEVLTTEGMKPLYLLEEGDKIQVNTYPNYSWEGNGNFSQGYLLGSLVGDGTFCYNNIARLSTWGVNKDTEMASLISHLDSLDLSKYKLRVNEKRNDQESRGLATLAKEFGVIKGNKTVSEIIEKTGMDFYKGFIQAYFDADGTVNPGKNKAGRMINLTSINLPGLQRVQRMLLRLGIFSRIRKNKYNGKPMLCPNSGKTYFSKLASRLDITGQKNILKFQEQIGFGFKDKVEKLDKLCASYSKGFYSKEEFATFERLDALDFEPVYDCTIENIHQFPANGLLVSNCLEILLKSRGSCLISNINLGLTTIESLSSDMVEGMEYLCKLHKYTSVERTNYYLPQEEDRQVGLGFIGLSNFLAINKIKYLEFVEALENLERDSVNFTVERIENLVKFYNSGVSKLSVTEAAVLSLASGFIEAAKVARSYNMERAFTVAPTASSFTRHFDLDGYSVSPEISAPIGREIERASETFGTEEYEFNPDCEIAFEVGWNTQFRLVNIWQRLMDSTGLAHSISMNIWSTKKVDRTFLQEFMDSAVKTTYYRMAINQYSNDKSSVVSDDTLEKMASAYGNIEVDSDSFIPEPVTEYPDGIDPSCGCPIDPIERMECSSCDGS